MTFTSTALGEGPADDAFDFEDRDTQEQASTDDAPNRFSVGGTLRLDWHAWTERLDDSPVAKGRETLDAWVRYHHGGWRAQLAARGEYDAAYRFNRDQYDAATLERYEWLVDIRESFVARTQGPLQLVVGRQIVNWGEASMISILDPINPHDLREPALADVDDLRLPVLASRAEYSRGAHRLDLTLVHEARYGFFSPPLGPFGLLLAIDDIEALVQDRVLRWEHRPERFTLDGQQAFGRWQYTGRGVDLGLYAATLLDRAGVFDDPDTSTQDIDLPIEHRRYNLVGTSGAVPVDSWVFRWELSGELDRPVNTRPTDTTLDTDRATLLRALGAVSYSGIDDLLLAIEWTAGRFVNEPDDALLFPIEAPLLAARGQWRALDGDLDLVAVLFVNGLVAEYGWIARLQASYRLRDGLKASMGYATFQPGDELSPISGFGSHDRLLAQLRWDLVFD